MERRTYNRSPIRLNAVIHDKMYHSWNFVIEDFGFDGLCLKWQSKSPLPESIKVNDLLDVKFEINQVNEFHLEVKVVRLLSDGLAVTLFNPALDALTDLSREQQQAGILNNASLESILDKKSHNTIAAIKQSFLNNLSHSTEIFLPTAHEALFQLAEKSVNNSEQALYFDSINTLNKSKKKLKDKFLQLIKAQVDSCCQDQLLHKTKQKTDNDLGELDLIDQNEFENWLAVNQLIVNVSPHYEQELTEIRLRLSHLYRLDADSVEVTPFSPEIIFKSFSEAIHEYFLSNDILLILYQQFEKVMDNHLFDIYKSINKIFTDNNVLPLIEKKKLTVVKSENDIRSAKPTVQAQETLDSSNRPATNNYVSSQSVNGSDADTVNGVNTSQAHTADTPVQTNMGQHMTEINTLQNDVNLVPTYQTLKELLTFQNDGVLDKGSQEFFASEDYQRQLSSLIDELTVFQKQYAQQLSESDDITVPDLSEVSRLIKTHQYSKELINEFEYTLDILKRLFDAIADDEWLGTPVKNLLSLMQLPILKVALLHKEFFESWENPARTVINKLAMVDFDDEKNTFFIKARSFVLYLLRNYERDLAVFSKIQTVLTQLLDIQAKHYNKNIEDIIKRWNAQQVVTNELATRLSGKQIPVVIADFISYQWLSILVSTYLNKGNKSSQWSQYLQALDMLILSMSGDVSDEFIERDVILFIIKQGMEENDQFNKKVLDDLEHFLEHGDSGHKITLDLETIIILLINGYALSDKTAIARINQGATDATALANKSIARRLNINDYVIFKQSQSNIRLQFVWGSDNKNVFVFSARTGQQAAVFNLMEVASMLESGKLSQTKDYDLPLLERTLYSILGDVHDDMALDSQLDDLTGFIIRKEFERLFAQEFKNRKDSNPQCAICLIDIDSFSLINDTCGYEAGDQYIAEIAKVLRQEVTDKAVVSRFGIDEFALVLPEHTEEEARQVADTLRKCVNGFSFCWEEKEFTLSASVGLVVIQEYNEPSLYLRAVVTATTIAKELGRNRVHLIEHDALELNHRQELQVWATKIDLMIRNSQLDIRGHRLHPILDNKLNPHYEMLLLVKDDEGNTMPPAEFIEAAELYNKMADVDRWVITYVLQWYSTHLDLLESLGGVAINLSGHSLNDVDFLSFVYEAFEKYPVPPERICFEITETVAIINMNSAINIIHAIKDFGCEFSLDDFGTGQSSYAYLKNLPVDYLKIDGVFIKDIVNNPGDQAMVKSINEIGHFLGMKTVAEFVENAEIIEVLKEIGVDYAQGYGVEMPMLIKEQVEKIASTT